MAADWALSEEDIATIEELLKNMRRDYKEIEITDEEKILGTNWLLDIPEGIRLYHDVAVPFREKA